ncbi:MAG: hypothetical protein LBG69_07400 [Zoogloeaceae bacterium]|nr:hypothetical protein [Zoogloeaceae bacterium]
MTDLTKLLPLEAVNKLVLAWSDYQKIHETEKTKRELIHADRDVQLESIRSQKDVLRDCIKRTFKERAGIFDKSFAMLDQGLASGNDQTVNAALGLITTTIKENPMKHAVQLIQDVHNPNVRVIEI